MVSGTVYPDHTAMPISRSDVKENDVVRVASRRPSKGKIPRKALTLADVHSSIKSIDHAIRGPIMARSFELQAELRNGIEKPFKNIIACNIGDAPAAGRPATTFYRQVLAYCSFPSLRETFPPDVGALGDRFLSGCSGGTFGSYVTDPQGLHVVRQDVAKYIQKRDGGDRVDPNNIFVMNGAMETIVVLLETLRVSQNAEKPLGIMNPVPTYPAYPSCMAAAGIVQVPYNLDESKDWQVDVGELRRAADSAIQCETKGIIVINPGNPTGQVLPRGNIEEVVRFAYDAGMFIIADEVYQGNVYDPSQKFHSFKQVMTDMGAPFCNMELISLHSASKGLMNECGARGGYAEFWNVDRDILDHCTKLLTIRSPHSTVGQLAIFTMVNPPQPGGASYDTFHREKEETLSAFAERAELVTKLFNDIPHIHCNPVQGAMYAFPRLELPAKYIQEAKLLHRKPDFHWVMQLLEQRGVVMVPGSGLGQVAGTYHFRTTILPPKEILHEMADRVRDFHTDLWKTYR